MPADAAAYRVVRLRGLREHPEAFTSSYEDDVQKPLAATQARLAAAESPLYGAFVDGVLAGGIGMSRESRGKGRHKADIVAMYVMPEFARRGIARALLARAIDEARAAGLLQLTLTVTQTNTAARELYASVGFATFGVEPRAIKVDGAYLAKEHMVLML